MCLWGVCLGGWWCGGLGVWENHRGCVGIALLCEDCPLLVPLLFVFFSFEACSPETACLGGGRQPPQVPERQAGPGY